jgi:flagellar hook-basal body complex protein FliE
MISGISSLQPLASLEQLSSATNKQSKQFGQFFSDALAQAEHSHLNAAQKTEGFLKGENLDLHNVAIAVQTAEMQFQFVQQVRNKMVSAYQEVMRTQL